jgi:predicted dehydrogenase
MPNDAYTSRSPAVSAAIVGGGFMARVHAAAIRSSGSELVGVLSSTPEKSVRAADEVGAPVAFSSLEQLLDSSVDVVHVCSPNSTHFSITEAALNASKHVICEKPLATNSADAMRLVRLAAQKGLVAAVPFVYRFHPLVREARELVRNGSVGDPHLVHGSYLQDWLLEPSVDNWRVDSVLGGLSRAFADIGSHLCDLVEFVLDDRIVRLVASVKTLHGERVGRSEVETEDSAAVVFETRRGVLGTFSVSQVAPGRKNRLSIEVSGSQKSVYFNQERPDEMWVRDRVSSSLLQRDAATLSPDAARLSRLPAGHGQGYQDAFNAFIKDAHQSIDGNYPEGLPRFEDGLRAVQITEAVLASHHSSSWVTVVESADSEAKDHKDLRQTADEMKTRT